MNTQDSLSESSESIRAKVDDLARQSGAKILAFLIGRFNDFQLAEDALQEALITALETWSHTKFPDNPIAWLSKTATNKCLDKIRRSSNLSKKLSQISFPNDGNIEETFDDRSIPDERLSLMFTCCHPALAKSAQIALTLKTLAGMSTEQIANAFVVPETTMAQRLVRAKKKIAIAGIPYQVPQSKDIRQRIDSVLNVIYFIFNEGYSPSTGRSFIDDQLCTEAQRLSLLLAQLLPDETECLGLYCLILLHMARFSARINDKGQFVDLQQQSRNLWNKDLIKKADKILLKTLMKGDPGPYQIQAAISAIHSQANDFSDTDWPQIVLLYQRLLKIDSNPVIHLNLSVRDFLCGESCSRASISYADFRY